VIRTPLLARRGAAALIVAACTAAIAVPTAMAQGSPSITVDPNQGAPGSQFTITLKNFHACAADSPNCIVIDFLQNGTTTTIGNADSHGSETFSGKVFVPPTAKPGPATVHAHSNIDDAPQVPFTVSGTPAPTTSTSAGPTTTTTAASSTTSSTTSSSSTTVTTVVLAGTTTTTSAPVTVKKSSSHSDVPRYIAVALVVLAAAATAAVDTRLRRLRGL
jgi:hypothetical protein